MLTHDPKIDEIRTLQDRLEALEFHYRRGVISKRKYNQQVASINQTLRTLGSIADDAWWKDFYARHT